MHFTPHIVCCALALGLLAGCADSMMAPAEESAAPGGPALGILEWERGPADARGAPSPLQVIAAPDTVRAGDPFDAVVTTIGPRSCWRALGAEVELRAALARVTPYDFTPETSESVCGDAQVRLARTVRLRFTQPGEGVVRVVGRKVEGRRLRETQRVTVEKRVVVRP